MCGFAGIHSEHIEESLFAKALDEIHYRGPDHHAITSVENLWLGHNRLAIIDLDVRSNQPFYSDDFRYCLIFNGEIYNYKSIKERLIKEGYKFRTASDTEVILHSYDKWKEKCFIQFHGMFSFALVDKLEKKLILARDRFGEKPLFYSLKDGILAFGSELRIFKKLMLDLKLNYPALIDFLHFGFVPAPKTVYNDVYKLLPGTYMMYDYNDHKTIQKGTFYDLSFNESHADLSLTAKKDLFQEIGDKVASEISIADVPLGAFLSGGVDSGGAVHFLKNATQSLQTFTAGFDSKQFDESPRAKLVAEHFGVTNINRKVHIDDFIGQYNNMIDHYAEPHNDFSFIPTYLICKEARKYHTVMISGDGADEIFCGYPRYHKLRQFSLLKSIKPLVKMGAFLTSLLPDYSNLKRQTHFIASDETNFFLSIMSMNFQPEEVRAIAGSVLLKHLSDYDSRDVISSHLDQCPHDNIVQKLRFLDIKLTLQDDMLVKVDRASMANSLEVRAFYLHPLIADFAFNLPLSDLVTYKHDKFFLKYFLEKKLPHNIVYEKKMGFTFPLKELIGGALKSFFNDCVSYIPEELINKSQIENIMKNHLKGARNYTAQLNSLMTLGLWFKNNS